MKNLDYYIKKLRDLDIFVSIIKVEREKKWRKFYRKTKRITDETLDFDISEYNFLVIDLYKSNLICLDIEGHPGSVESFYSFIKNLNIKEENLLIEKTMNKGLHLYFRNNYNLKKESKWNNFNNIHFDILTKRAFTSPSIFKNKKYEWIGNNFFKLKNKEDFPLTPKWVLELTKNKEKYFY